MSTAPGSAPVVELRDVSRSFGDVRAVDHVSLAIRSGEFFALLGPSGCGKTTTLRILAGFERPSGGDVYLAGRRVNDVPPYRRETNLVFQQLALFPHQRVAIARALVNEPAVLLLDEPLGSLDLKLRLAMQRELKAMQRRSGTTFVYVTHDQGEALAMADRVAVMSAGRILQVGSPEHIYTEPATRFVAHFIGDANVIEVVVTGGDEAGRGTFEAGALRFSATGRGDLRAGERRHLSLRPEKIKLASRAGTAPAYEGRVSEVTFLGPLVRYEVIVGDLRLIVQSQTEGEEHFARGDPVMVSWSPSAPVLLED